MITKQELVDLFSMHTSEVLEHNRELLLDNLMKNCTSDDSYEQVYAKMFMNAIDISVQTSVQILIDGLIEMNIIDNSMLKYGKILPDIRLVKGDKT